MLMSAVTDFREGIFIFDIHCTKCLRWVHRCYSDVPWQMSLLSCQDAFVCRTCLGHNCSVEEKLGLKGMKMF